MDSQYVSRTLGRCLSEALAELIELRPLDPIEFLALWIRKYKHNQELELQKAAHQRELEEEKRLVHEENLHQRDLEEEENRIRAAQHVPEPTDESKPDLCEDERESAADPPERASEPKDQEDQPSEILNTEEDQSAGTEADAPERTGEDPDETRMEKEEDEEDDGA
ncbi:hypothetical protein R3I94_019337 [Phoxinus phoxinus]|uniref:DPY30 domain-containing protein 1 n=1 Tax=Phoxinus phoxinus TaxID=58324 RepID=A0AAN9GZ30_9TELE